MGISGAKDGTEIELVVEKDGEVLIADRQPVYGGKAEFSLNPNYYHADSFMIATDPENQGISWNSLAVYTGQYDTNTDQVIFDEDVITKRIETEAGSCLKVSEELTKSLENAINNNYGIKVFLTVFASLL
ncbi:MAG TPA: hypothetical protein IAA08_00450, partial [Candidatus Eubacterium avistercoris]|nr:hypothetical protein [Candidatus Eubacterium avistercoris]